MQGWIFDLVCPGYAFSVSHERLLLLKSATVNRNLSFGDVCKEKHVHVAYNNHVFFYFNESIGEMIKFPVEPYVRYMSIAFQWEIQEAFFASYNIKPTWLYANQIRSKLNYTTGQWSGIIGMIQRDEADYALGINTAAYDRSEVVAFSITKYIPMYWFTRYPRELTPTWNLFGLFTKEYISQLSFL